jgi:hypothetical protein
MLGVKVVFEVLTITPPQATQARRILLSEALSYW